MCGHSPSCPSAKDSNCCQAHVDVDHFEQGWCRLCNGVIVFDDGTYLTPDGEIGAIPLVVPA